MKKRIIPRSFFRGDPITCSRQLIGAELVWGKCAGIIVETEAYLAENDEAAHTFTRPSIRAFVARNQPGTAYVYFSYGAHWMLNVLVKGGEADGFVLFRAVQPTRGIGLMKKRRGTDEERQLCSGPGKLTQAFAITKRHDEMDLCSDPLHCFMTGAKAEVVADRRIGITRSVHHPWRFTLRDSEFISRRVKL